MNFIFLIAYGRISFFLNQGDLINDSINHSDIRDNRNIAKSILQT